MEKASRSSMEAHNGSVTNLDTIPPKLSSSPPASKVKPRGTRQTLAQATSRLARPFKKANVQFTLFPELPAEIRVKIWEASVEGRVHELHPCANLYQNRMTFRSNASSTPSIFHVSQESRKVAEKHYQLMEYSPSNHENEDGSTVGKGILRFYFAPKHDVLLLNSLMGLFVMFMLLEEGHSQDSILNTGGPTAGVMKGWERVAIDAERAQLITLLSGPTGRSPQPKFRKLIPNLKELIIAFDYTSSGKTRFRTSVWPGENGTSLRNLRIPKRYEDDWSTLMDGCLNPLRGFLSHDYRVTDEEVVQTLDERDRAEIDREMNVPIVTTAKVQRKRFVRGDLRYAIRWSCSLIGVRPRGWFRRL